MAENETIRSVCPDCGARLVVDRATGEIVSHSSTKSPPAGGKSFEGLLAGLEAERSEAESLFEREMAVEKDRDRLLDQKFKAAMRRVADEPEDQPPPRPFDFD